MAPEEEQYEDLPPELIERLKAADRPMPIITAQVDGRIDEMARGHFSTRRKFSRRMHYAWTAMAATVLLAVFLVQTRVPTVRAPADQHEDGLYTDIDRSGRIDIADVLALARAQEPGKPSQAQLDAFAARIVSLNRPSGDAS